MKQATRFLTTFLCAVGLSGCWPFAGGEAKPRMVLFLGVDISGSFLNSPYFADGLDFTAHYLHAHMQGYGGLEKPSALFVGSIGGASAGEPKTFYPIQTFENLDVIQIREKLVELFPREKSNPFTDYNAFFEQVSNTVKEKNLVLKPLTIVMLSDGQPDVPGKKAEKGYRAIRLKPLETLSRNVTVRLLYTDAVVGAGWKSLVPRRRVKIWTQDAKVMTGWKSPTLLAPASEFAGQDRFFAWTRDNVDFNVRAKRVD
jgi:hypothetical protein